MGSVILFCHARDVAHPVLRLDEAASAKNRMLWQRDNPTTYGDDVSGIIDRWDVDRALLHNHRFAIDRCSPAKQGVVDAGLRAGPGGHCPVLFRPSSSETVG